MTKQHFISLANTLIGFREVWGDSPEFRALLVMLANWCQDQSPRFDKQRWLGYIEGKVGPSGGRKGNPVGSKWQSAMVRRIAGGKVQVKIR